jgi:hypothetical protein
MFDGATTVLEREEEVPALVARADRAHRAVGRAQLELLGAIGEVDRSGGWCGEEVHSCAQWVQLRYGVSAWKAQRWVAAARELEVLPVVSEALETGELGVDKVVELTRFATPGTEAGLVGWGKRVSSGAIRHRGDVELQRERGEVAQRERERSVRWWYSDEGRRFELEAVLPAASGAVVAAALEREASRLPVLPTDATHPELQEVRWADGLVALCSGRLSTDPDPDRATVVLHAPLGALQELPAAGATGGTLPDREAPCGETLDGAVIPAETVRRLVCSGRVQVAVEDPSGEVLSLGRSTRSPSASQVRLVRHRDRGCVFPGCGTNRYTQVHHVRWWRHGGKTDLENLALVCSLHHRLVHEHGWRLTRESGRARWFRPDGERYRAGPGPP